MNFLEPIVRFAETNLDRGNFFGIPTWYKYLPGGDVGNPRVESLNDFWLIGVVLLEMLMWLAGTIAVGYFIYSGFVFMTSQGSPDRVAAGRKGMLNATIGLVIAVVAANLVAMVAGIFL